MKIDFANIQRQYAAYKNEIDAAIAAVLRDCRFIMGPDITELEANLAAYTGVRHVITCASGTDALLLSLMALGVGPGCEVITTPFTFFATSEMISLLGAKPVFVDILPDTYNVNPDLIERAVTPATKAIIGVSLYGQCADYDALQKIADKHGIGLIEDGCQSFGARYKNKLSCDLTELACTSFFPSKPLGCYGDGGAVFTSNNEYAEKIRQLRNHGQEERYRHGSIGINGRMDTIQAAVVNVKLRHFNDELLARGKSAAYYTSFLKNNSDFVAPTVKSECTSVYAQYSVRTSSRDAVLKKLQDKGIPYAIHYPIPLYRQSCYQHLQINPDTFPVTEKVCTEIFSLPMNAFQTEEELEYICTALK